MIDSNWIVNPQLGFVSILSEYGRFLEDDYRMALEELILPNTFEPYVELTGRRFLLVGAKETPWMLAKSAYLCLSLAGPESVVVTTPNIDESFMVQNVFDHHGEGIRTKLLLTHTNDLLIDNEIYEEAQSATDIIVFGDDNTCKVFREYETVDRRVWERNHKFSFGIIREDDLTPTNINQICFDFFSFYGEGSLAPKFYFIVGKLRKKHSRQFANTMTAFYGSMINAYRDKLPITRKSDLVRQKIRSQYVGKFIRYDSLNSETMFDNLYGDVRLITVDDIDDIEDFIEEWHDRISTVAINTIDDRDSLDMLEDQMIMRICEYGNMQFPEFFDQYDTVDDFIIFSKEDEIDDPFIDPDNYI